MSGKRIVFASWHKTLLWIDSGPFHCRPTSRVSSSKKYTKIVALERMGMVRVMPRNGRFPSRVVVTSDGSHYLGTFDSIEELT